MIFQIAHVIREIRQFQQTPYNIEKVEKVVHYILDPDLLLDDDDLYQRSLQVRYESRIFSLMLNQDFLAGAEVFQAVVVLPAHGGRHRRRRQARELVNLRQSKKKVWT